MASPRSQRLIPRLGLSLGLLASCSRPFGANDVELTPCIEIIDGGATVDGGADAKRAPATRKPRPWEDVTTQHNDAARTGGNLRERFLRPANVASLREDRPSRA